MSDAPAKQAKRRWSAYVCPDCRLVFRLPMHHDGRGTVCPSCARLLRIPRDGDPVPPLTPHIKESRPD